MNKKVAFIMHPMSNIKQERDFYENILQLNPG